MKSIIILLVLSLLTPATLFARVAGESWGDDIVKCDLMECGKKYMTIHEDKLKNEICLNGDFKMGIESMDADKETATVGADCKTPNATFWYTCKIESCKVAYCSFIEL